jgi:predicted tellurium resistance membrane protein TerC
MFSPRRMAAIFCGLLLAGWVLHADAPPAPAAALADGVPVEVERTDGWKMTGVLRLGAVKLQTEYGTAELNVGKVRQLSLVAENDGRVTASATLTDKSYQSGPLLTESFPVEVNGRTEQLRPADVRQVTFKHPRTPSLTAALIGLVTLTLLEIVLGVDNVIFLAIVAAKLPEPQQRPARRIGLLAALVTRLLLLASLAWLLGLTRPLFTLPELPFFYSVEARAISWRDLILLVGGVFLIGKSVFEMHEKLEHARAQRHGVPRTAARAASFASVILQIAVIDIIFSLDSVITAVGMVEELWVMVTAVVIAVGVMLVAAEPIARFVDRRPTVKVLALSFLILIGVLLVAEGLGQHLDKGYIYFAMAFAVGVELVNSRLRGSPSPVPGEMPESARGG